MDEIETLRRLAHAHKMNDNIQYYNGRGSWIQPDALKMKLEAPRGLGWATASQVVGIISLVMWPLGGVAMLLGLVGINMGRGRSQLIVTRAMTGIVTGALSSSVVAAACVLLALHSGR